MSNTAITVLIAVLIQLLLHWFPWRAFLGRKLPRLAAYVMGTAGIALPFTDWLRTEQLFDAALALWITIVACGIAVGLAHGIDALLETRARAHIAEEAERLLKHDQDAA